MADKKNGAETARPMRGGKITKNEAVRRALVELGDEAKLADLKEWIKNSFGYEMSTNHISTSKGDIFRKRGGPPKPAGKKRGPKPKAPPLVVLVPVVAESNRKDSIVIEDVLALKDLVERVGPTQLRTLIDALAK